MSHFFFWGGHLQLNWIDQLFPVQIPLAFEVSFEVHDSQGRTSEGVSFDVVAT